MFTPELIGIFLYLALQLAFGLMVSRSIKTQDDYLLAGRQVGPVLGLFSIFATWFGAETCIGAAVADSMSIEAELGDAFAAGDMAAARRSALRLRYLRKLVDEARARHARQRIRFRASLRELRYQR